MDASEEGDHAEALCSELKDEKQKSTPTSTSLKKRKLIIWKNVVLISISFAVTFMAFQSLQALQSSLNSTEGLGVTALSVLYSVAILTNILFTPLIISKKGCKWTLVTSTFGYVGFALAHLYPTWYTLIPGAAIVGVAAGPLWASKCTYLTKSALEYSKIIGKKQGPVVTHFFGVFFAIVQCGSMLGGLLMSVILKPGGEKTPLVANTTMTMVCGRDDCPSQARKLTNGASENIADQKSVILLMSIFSGAIFLSGIFMMIFVDSIKKAEEDDGEVDIKSQIGATVRMAFKDRRMLFLLPLQIYASLLPGFVAVDFSKSYVTCSLGISSLGFIFMCMIATQAAFSVVIGQVERLMGRRAIMFGTYVIAVAMLVFLLTWNTGKYPRFVFYIMAFVFGLLRCTLRTETNSYAGILFPDDLKTAFAVVRTCTSLGLLISFAWGYHVCVYVKIYIHIAFLSLSMICYFITEYLDSKGRQRKDTVGEKVELAELKS